MLPRHQVGMQGKEEPRFAYASSSTLPFSETYRPSKNCSNVMSASSQIHRTKYKSTEHMVVWCIQTMTYLPDILVSHSADLLDIGCALRNVLERVTPQLQLILLVLRWLDLNTWLHDNSSDKLLTNEVSGNFVSHNIPYPNFALKPALVVPPSDPSSMVAKRTGSQPRTSQSRSSSQR